MNIQELQDLITQANLFRLRAHEETQIYRAFAGKSDGKDGLIIDVLGQVVWVRVFCESEVKMLHELYAVCQKIFTNCNVYLSYRKIANYWILPDSAAQENWSCSAKEQNIAFELRNKYLEDFGIYPDSRAARTWLLRNSASRKVLNLFAYTCAFGVVAACGDAAEVSNVDVSKEFLSWGKRNAAINNVDFSVVPEDCLKYLHRLHNRIRLKIKSRPEIIVIDPPAFLAGRGARRVTRNLWPEYLQSAVQILEPGGSILVSCNDSFMLKRRKFSELLREEFQKVGADPKLKLLNQTSDVKGMNPQQDSFYLPPQFWVANF